MQLSGYAVHGFHLVRDGVMEGLVDGLIQGWSKVCWQLHPLQNLVRTEWQPLAGTFDADKTA